METVDVAIIGAGVVGCACARELARYSVDVLVLERAHDLGEGSSKANSGVVHVGFQPRGGSLKGTSCAEGNRRFTALAEELDIPFKRVGGMMVAFNDEGVQKLREKQARAEANGCGVLPIVSGDEARNVEPRLSGRVVAALMAPNTGIITPFDLVFALAQNAHANGVRFRFDAQVERLERARGAGARSKATQAASHPGWLIHLSDGTAVRARYVLNMAGDAAALLDAQVHPADYHVRPRAGDFVVMDKQDPTRAITHVIYQAAETDEGGTLVSPTVEGNLLIGPTSRNVSRFTNTASTPGGIAHVLRVAKKLIPDLDEAQVITNFAGVRANIVNVPKELKDFVVRASAPGFVSALGIKNPGLTSSPVLAERAVQLLAEEGLALEPDPSFSPLRERVVPFLKCTAVEQGQLLAVDESFGRVVCRCEGVTEGDVRALLAGPLAPTTMAGVKKRLRCGMGRCQGSYCTPRVLRVMAEHAGVREYRIPAGGGKGRVVIRGVK